MNAIQQISLKLQLGIDPATDINPEELRSMWTHVVELRDFPGKQKRARGGLPTAPARQLDDRH